jgi:hypothetical protein
MTNPDILASTLPTPDVPRPEYRLWLSASGDEPVEVQPSLAGVPWDENSARDCAVGALSVAWDSRAYVRLEHLAHPERRGAHAYRTTKVWIVVNGAVVESPVAEQGGGRRRAGRLFPGGGSLLILQVFASGEVQETPFDDENEGRAAWLAARGDGAESAALIRTHGAFADRYRCEWSARGGFCDRTAAHASAIDALCEELTDAPGNDRAITRVWLGGSFVSMIRRTRDGGVLATHHLGEVAFNTAERVRAHWAGFAPASTAGGAS